MKQINILFVLIIITLSSCVNNLVDNNEETQNRVIRLKGNLIRYSDTRVYDDRFESSDQVGVFILGSGGNITDERYLDNVLYTYDSESNLKTLEDVTFPLDNSNVDIYSYYPYNANGIDANDSKLKVSINKDQSNKGNYSASDFLFAKKVNVAPTSDAIELTYEHSFSKLNIILSFPDNTDMNEVLSKNPTITFVHFPTSCYYDISNDKFLTFSDFDNISPHGDWIVKDKTLVGKSLILIPHSPQLPNSSISLSYNGTEYTVSLPDNFTTHKGVQRDLEIHINPTSKTSELKLTDNISPWKYGDKITLQSSHISKYINLSSIDFSKSNVYTISSNNQPIGQICREYISIKQPSQSFQSITYYPFESSHKPNLTKGKVLKVLNNNSNVHFGTISWDTNNQATYTPGDKAYSDKLYISSDKECIYSPQSSSTLLPILSTAHLVHDVRQLDVYSYPIVKVGIQYWLCEDIKSTHLVTKTHKMSTADSRTYIKTPINTYVYSKRAVESLSIIPKACRLPHSTDWQQLSAYLSDDASKLKSGQWIAYNNLQSTPATNDTFFGATSSIVYHNTVSSSPHLSTLYATVDDTGNIDTHNTILLISHKNEIINNIKESDKRQVMYTVRCMLK